MHISSIDEGIERYLGIRIEKGRQSATERFLSYAYLKFNGGELAEFMGRVYRLSRYHMNLCSVMQNPLKGPELAWFAALLSIALFSCILMYFEEYRIVGLPIFFGMVVNAGNLLKAVLKKQCEQRVLRAIYQELAELAEHEAQQLG